MVIKASDYNHRLYGMAIEGKSGDWEIKKAQVENPTPIISYDWRKGTHFSGFLDIKDPGEYFPVVTLSCRGNEVMTTEVREHTSYQPAVEGCKGEMLMVGLGVGLLPSLVWDKLGKEVVHLDILEYELDVINLVSKYLNHPLVTIIKGDALEFFKTCTKRYDFIFLDIWNGNAEAVVSGPSLLLSYSSLLKPSGKVRYWLQEIGDKLLPTRGFPDKDYIPCLICGGGEFQGHSKLYGGLCMECAYEYETHKGGFEEAHSNGDLSNALNSLGFKAIREYSLPNGQRVDIMIDGITKYIIEGKNNLDITELEGLIGKLQRYSRFKEEISGVKLVIYGKVTWEAYIRLKEDTKNLLGGWVEVFCRDARDLR